MFPTIPALHAAYAQGRAPAAVIADTYRRIEAMADPGTFISLVPEDSALASLTALGTFDPNAKPLWGILLSSRTISTLQACRLPQHARHTPTQHPPRLSPSSVCWVPAQS
ncbi:MAG TPA: hypothetical protein VMB34_26930 [Acetobacteraceae bacterium]|nr:hypothetical protein [Acetobacteraceae bacterium]